MQGVRLSQPIGAVTVPSAPPELQARMDEALSKLPDLRDRVGEIVAVRDAAVAHLAAACPPDTDIYTWGLVYGPSQARELWCGVDSIADAIEQAGS